MDTVFITGLVLHTLIGVYEFERDAKQRIIIDLEMNTSLKVAGASDNVKDTVDYGKVAETLAEIANKSSYQLLEALAEDMAKNLFSNFDITELTLTIHKPDILNGVDSVGIILRRQKADYVSHLKASSANGGTN